MKAYSLHTNEEKIAMTEEYFLDSVRLQAIEQGVKPSITLSEALSRSEWTGFHIPAQAVPVYEIGINSYSSTGVGYLDKTQAEKALEGAVRLEHGYGSQPPKIVSGESLYIRTVYVGYTDAFTKASKFEAFQEDNSDYDKVVEACVADRASLVQAAYNAKVKAEKKKEYLRLANGDESIAMGFWAKTERTDWN